MKIKDLLQRFLMRQSNAHLLMISFIVFTGTGAALIELPYGLITIGLCSGVYGYLLGRE
jgi:hypothetical protein